MSHAAAPATKPSTAPNKESAAPSPANSPPSRSPDALESPTTQPRCSSTLLPQTPHGPGYLTVFPCGTKQPLASNVNYNGNDIRSNAVLAKIGTNGNVCVYTSADTDLIIDINGYIPGT